MTKPALDYEPGMSLGDFQGMIAKRDRPLPTKQAGTITPAPNVSAARFAKLRNKLDAARRELARTKGRLATAERRAARCKEQHGTKCAHPFNPDALNVEARRDPRGLLILSRFVCPDCGTEIVGPRKLARR